MLTRRNTMKNSLMLAGCVVGILTGCDAGYGATQAGKADIQVLNNAGSTTLIGQPGLRTATVVITPRGLSEEEVTEHFKVSQVLGNGALQLLIERVKSDKNNADMFLDVTINAPPEKFFQQDNPHGDAEVRDMTGGGQVRSLGGNVRLSNVTGKVEAEARDNLDILGHTCGDTLRALAQGGDINVEVVKDCKADVRAAAKDGVNVDGVDFGGISTPEAVWGNIGGKGHRIDMAAQKGSITFMAQ
jgi:hypothetical protein